MPTTVKVKEKFQVTIPEKVREAIPLKVGEKVEVIARGNEIVIRPVIEIPREQSWYWTKEWQEQVNRARRELREGKYRRFKSVKEARKLFGD
ncbi:MAG: AbrB/MazE/SpoVT family DNA-binding domain-containing protein [Nitrospirota bacterium]